MNQATIAGHLGADPEVRFTSSGQKVTTLRIAARVRRGGKDETIWWRVSVWGEQFDKMIAFLKKGSPVIVFGELNKPEIFTDREGRPQISMSMTAYHIAFSPFGRSEGAAAEAAHGDEQQPAMAAASQSSYGQGKRAEAAFNDDEVPF